MAASKDNVVTTIAGAKASLEQALADLEHLPAFDSGQIAFAAHALNNFLGVIRGTAELLLISLRNNRDIQVRIKAEALVHAADLMTHTVNQLMNTSAPAKPRLIYDHIDLASLVQKACDYYKRVADKKKIGIVFTSTQAPTAWSDRVAVAAVLDNLLSNAVKYSPRETSVSVTVSARSPNVICSVRDEGPGISPDDQAKLFQRGVRLSAVPTGGEPSTGYGLAVAKELIDNLSGEMWCDSELGHGACFSISLPCHPPDNGDANPPLEGTES
jgi:signal transduction histidine kinase